MHAWNGGDRGTEYSAYQHIDVHVFDASSDESGRGNVRVQLHEITQSGPLIRRGRRSRLAAPEPRERPVRPAVHFVERCAQEHR